MWEVAVWGRAPEWGALAHSVDFCSDRFICSVERWLTKGGDVKITLELSPDIEVRLRESVAHGDAETVRRLLAEVLTPTVETLLQKMPVN